MAEAAEIAQLLDQCNPEELNNILLSIEQGGDLSEFFPKPDHAGLQPTPPAAPPPGNGRRPGPANVKPVQAVAASTASGGAPVMSMEEVKKLMEEHSESVMSEVRKMIPNISNGIMDSIDIGTLTQALTERDQEVKALEARLTSLNSELAQKDTRAAVLGNELDTTLREVRHRQLDLEFQQLKLEERVRNNAELEQAQRVLSARVEEATLNARHAALEADMGRYTPRTMRAQGSLPWTMRKNRLPMGNVTTDGKSGL
ncbi:unnamed protein product [Polarella glacialis]|uniref:Uncharacterized protein n=1 Tax=Polarella glacialis TaxID=89957 RepID=A0A813KZZ9_POLGL|nr:unnamed protein product [Polarella glacialis]|mmetsp:Transcript_55683/g.100120  ORF Transcript_55683/g.100120 Transcript_55683/m.100120 type:complete len:257 (+) Transcript_55683:123-893(+)